MSKTATEQLDVTNNQLFLIMADNRLSIAQRDSSIVLLTAQRDIANKRAEDMRAVLDNVDKVLKKSSRRIKWLQWQRNIAMAFVVVETGYLVYLSAK